MISSWRSLLFYFLWTATSRADELPFDKDERYNDAEYGRYVQQHFKTSNMVPPRINFMQPFNKPECNDGSYIFVAPRGNVPNSSFYILDHEGSLIWGPDHHYGEVYNFQVQTYKGEDYLVFWAGDDSIGGHGEGKYFMLDKHYEEHAKISAGDGIRGDLHAFTINDDDTAIYTGYEIVQHDLTELGRAADSWIWESLFQELDINTGEVLFEWRASEHFDFHWAYVNPNKALRHDPWDFFHINMVEKDDLGNYLVSTRYGRCVLYISGKTKEILWTLGGKNNSFKDLSGGQATTFLGQHDAHWYDGHNYITMFDNRGDWFHKIEDKSHGHKIKVDLEKMTAELEQSYVHPAEILSTSQGSMQILPNGNVLMGYGFNGVFTEFSEDGTALCDAYMLPSKRFGSGDVQSYRNLKSNWTGIPLTTPDIVAESGTLYMSWLGSTKVRSWLLQDSDMAEGDFTSVQTIPKVGFETEFQMNSGKRMRQYVRAIAVDAGGTQLSVSNSVQIVDPQAIWGEGNGAEHHDEPAHDHDHDPEAEAEEHHHESMKEDLEDGQILLILGVLALISAVLVAFMTFGKRFLPFRAMRSTGEKDWSMGTNAPRWAPGAVLEKVRSSIPLGGGRMKRFRDFSGGAGRGLLGSDGSGSHDRDDSLGDAEVEFGNERERFSLDDDMERGR